MWRLWVVEGVVGEFVGEFVGRRFETRGSGSEWAGASRRFVRESWGKVEEMSEQDGRHKA